MRFTDNNADKLETSYKELAELGTKAVRSAQLIATSIAADAAGFALIALETQSVVETYNAIITAPTPILV